MVTRVDKVDVQVPVVIPVYVIEALLPELAGLGIAVPNASTAPGGAIMLWVLSIGVAGSRVCAPARV